MATAKELQKENEELKRALMDKVVFLRIEHVMCLEVSRCTYDEDNVPYRRELTILTDSGELVIVLESDTENKLEIKQWSLESKL